MGKRKHSSKDFSCQAELEEPVPESFIFSCDSPHKNIKAVQANICPLFTFIPLFPGFRQQQSKNSAPPKTSVTRRATVVLERLESDATPCSQTISPLKSQDEVPAVLPTRKLSISLERVDIPIRTREENKVSDSKSRDRKKDRSRGHRTKEEDLNSKNLPSNSRQVNKKDEADKNKTVSLQVGGTEPEGHSRSSKEKKTEVSTKDRKKEHVSSQTKEKVPVTPVKIKQESIDNEELERTPSSKDESKRNRHRLKGDQSKNKDRSDSSEIRSSDRRHSYRDKVLESAQKVDRTTPRKSPVPTAREKFIAQLKIPLITKQLNDERLARKSHGSLKKRSSVTKTPPNVSPITADIEKDKRLVVKLTRFPDDVLASLCVSKVVKVTKDSENGDVDIVNPGNSPASVRENTPGILSETVANIIDRLGEEMPTGSTEKEVVDTNTRKEGTSEKVIDVESQGQDVVSSSSIDGSKIADQLEKTKRNVEGEVVSSSVPDSVEEQHEAICIDVDIPEPSEGLSATQNSVDRVSSTPIIVISDAESNCVRPLKKRRHSGKTDERSNSLNSVEKSTEVEVLDLEEDEGDKRKRRRSSAVSRRDSAAVAADNDDDIEVTNTILNVNVGKPKRILRIHKDTPDSDIGRLNRVLDALASDESDNEPDSEIVSIEILKPDSFMDNTDSSAVTADLDDPLNDVSI